MSEKSSPLKSPIPMMCQEGAGVADIAAAEKARAVGLPDRGGAAKFIIALGALNGSEFVLNPLSTVTVTAYVPGALIVTSSNINHC
jgi:hypothetical protein